MPYQKLRDVLDNHSACMNEVSEPSLIHWDLWDGNLLIENGQITGIIDFERALWGDPLIEYYFTNASLDNTAFKKGYGRYEQLSVMEQKRVLYYRLYLNLIMYVECYYRGYSDEAHIAWASSNVKQAIASFMEEIDRER
jgi:thiamine kinase-like enzyme